MKKENGRGLIQVDDLHKAICRVVEDAEKPVTTNDIVLQLRDVWDAQDILRGLNRLTRDNILEIDFLETGPYFYLVAYKFGPKAPKQPLPYSGLILGTQRRGGG